MSTINSFKSNFFKKITFSNFFLCYLFSFLMLKQNGLNFTSFLLYFLGASTQFANTRTLNDYQYGIIDQLATLFPFVVVIMEIIIHFFYYLLHRMRTPFASITNFIMFLVFLWMSYLINTFTSIALLAIGFIIYIVFNLNMMKFNYKSSK